MLSAKLARRARPPLGVCQPQGLVLPLTSVVERMISLSGWSFGALAGAVAPARASQRTRATAKPAESRVAHDVIASALLGIRGSRGRVNRTENTGVRQRASRLEPLQPRAGPLAAG